MNFVFYSNFIPSKNIHSNIVESIFFSLHFMPISFLYYPFYAKFIPNIGMNIYYVNFYADFIPKAWKGIKMEWKHLCQIHSSDSFHFLSLYFLIYAFHFYANMKIFMPYSFQLYTQKTQRDSRWNECGMKINLSWNMHKYFNYIKVAYKWYISGMHYWHFCTNSLVAAWLFSIAAWVFLV